MCGACPQIHTRSQQLRGVLAGSSPDPAHQRDRFHGAELDPIRREEHPIEGLMHRCAIAGHHQQVGAGVVCPHQRQGAHAAGGADQTGGQAGAAGGQFNRLTALSMQEAARIGSLQPDAADRGAPAGRGGEAHERLAADTAATSSSRNRLCSSSPAAVMASRPPSWRSTIVTTRFTV